LFRLTTPIQTIRKEEEKKIEKKRKRKIEEKKKKKHSITLQSNRHGITLQKRQNKKKLKPLDQYRLEQNQHLGST